jgi:hypothetical protein
MDPFIWFFYVASLAVIGANLSVQARRLSRLRTRIGEPKAKWSGSFNLSIPMGRVRGAVVLIYLGWCAYQIVQNPLGNGGHLSLMLLGIILSFAPRENVYLGSNGIIHRLKFIAWAEIRGKKIPERDQARYLVVDSGRIRLPKKVSDFFLDSLLKGSR